MISSRLKRLIRPLHNLLWAFGGFAYDFSRYVRYGGWRAHAEHRRRDYKAVKIYHQLEKSLSFRERRANSGWEAAGNLLRVLERRTPATAGPGYHESVGVKVLRDFAATADGGGDTARRVQEFLQHVRQESAEGGVIDFHLEELLAGKLEDPERFFCSRHSVRDFRPGAVPRELMRRAMKLAMRTPSVCNRQAWHVYQMDSRGTIDRALALQNGNRGFGHEVPCLLIITADLRAFDTHGERFQHWVDGGMFAMSLALALHSLGLASCFLNWSRGAREDRRLRRVVPIDPAHTVITMMAVGFASDEFKVCYSARRPIDSILTYLDDPA
ncbi:nitroreductase family protein [Dyella sp.]|jgi:nitroreductase|uniref:nitroreductase family protein n=1 Tax=Dyella sp. TaxID=1869338 RepID=UPI002D781E4B|nr:nitroreductase family protein [Dyella sp.]HET6431605.1 nitroreductase family protein [Dyella sp.]